MMLKVFAILMAFLLFPGNAGYDTSSTDNGPIHWNEIDYLETEELFLMDMEEQGLTDYVLRDSSEVTAEVIESRMGTTLIERCIGVVTNAQTGDGKILNASSEDFDYISYRGVDQDCSDGTVFLTYLVYSPDNNLIDDIVARYDFVISRAWES